MIKYQLRFCDSKGHGSFVYIDAGPKEDALQKAADKATEYINNQRQSQRMFSSFRPKRVINVWEMDMETKRPKKGGHRFKLQLMYITYTYLDGSKTRDEWYEPIK